jgi:hypothetical protein
MARTDAQQTTSVHLRLASQSRSFRSGVGADSYNPLVYKPIEALRIETEHVTAEEITGGTLMRDQVNHADVG